MFLEKGSQSNGWLEENFFQKHVLSHTHTERERERERNKLRW